MKPDGAYGYVFPAERGDGFYQTTSTVWQAAIKKADLAGVTPHVLRHTLGNATASAREALLMVGSLLGHTNARSTAIYAHLARPGPHALTFKHSAFLTLIFWGGHRHGSAMAHTLGHTLTRD